MLVFYGLHPSQFINLYGINYANNLPRLNNTAVLTRSPVSTEINPYPVCQIKKPKRQTCLKYYFLFVK